MYGASAALATCVDTAITPTTIAAAILMGRLPFSGRPDPTTLLVRGQMKWSAALSSVFVPVEEVVGRVRHERLGADVRRRGATRRRRQASCGIQSLNEGRVGQLVATPRTFLRSD